MEISSAVNITTKRDTATKATPDILTTIGLFVIALIPRLLALSKFITADEPRWAVRSMAFLTGLLTADFPLTLQTGHPGVTTMWSGTIGLALNYLLNHQADGSLLAFVQSLPNNYQRIDPTILPWMRLPIVFLSALSVAAVFWFVRPLNRTAAIIAALLLAFHPLHLAHSQLLHHDALVSVFITFSILLFLTTLRHWSWTLLALSGLMAGLALLSKSTAYALPPYVGLVMLIEVVYRRQTLTRAVLAGLVWGGIVIAAVVALWPAMWVVPTEVGQTIVSWINESADVENVSNTLLPSFSGNVADLGLFFYPVNWLLKTTPLMILGLVFFIPWWRGEAPGSPARWWTARLWLWVGLFTLMLTVGDKRDGRYLLPIYFALCILVAFGLTAIYERLKNRWPLSLNARFVHTNFYQIGFILLLLATSVTYYPYYLTYYNPLVGGPWLAPKLVKVGMGEGMEQAAAWLNNQPNAGQLTVATDLPQAFAPLFVGKTTHPDMFKPFSADYVLNYTRQIQGGVPFREYWHYYQARPPEFKVSIAGIDHLWLHKLPPLASVGRIAFSDNLILRAYTTNQPLATPGKDLIVTLIWRAKSPTREQARLQLRDGAGQVWAESAPSPVFDPNGPSEVEGHYILPISANTPRGQYSLWVTLDSYETWVEFAPMPVGYSEPATALSNSVEANFAHQIALHGFDISNSTPAAGETVTLTFHWQALQPISYDFTNFIHVVDSKNSVVAQSDVQPGQGQWPTTTWHPGEWITDQVSISLPAELPPGQYQLIVGWYHLETGQRLPLAGNETQDTLHLESLTVQQ